jgi:hypothetical protein
VPSREVTGAEQGGPDALIDIPLERVKPLIWVEGSPKREHIAPYQRILACP